MFLNSLWWCNQSGYPPKENFAKVWLSTRYELKKRKKDPCIFLATYWNLQQNGILKNCVFVTFLETKED
jgi:hypothetical protein